MYQLLYFSWKIYHPITNNSGLYGKNVYKNKLDPNISKSDTSSNNSTINVIVNKELIKKIDKSIECTEKQIVSWFSCI